MEKKATLEVQWNLLIRPLEKIIINKNNNYDQNFMTIVKKS